METNKTEKQKKSKMSTPWIQSLFIMVVVFGALGGFLYWVSVRNTVFIENSYLEAPTAKISPETSGNLSAINVKIGDTVTPNTQIAVVGSEIVYAKNSGVVASAPEVIGTYFSPGQTLVSIVDVNQMKVVGQVDETGGLEYLQSGERATFSVDAFPYKTFEGVVDTVSPVSEDNGVIFSISDQRPVRKFDVKVRFDHSKYPELKSGMSAKITVYTK